MFTQFVAAAGVLALLTIVPGPDMAVVTRRSLASGRGDGLRTAGGIVVGLAVWGLLTVVGLAAVLAASATAYTLVKLLGAVYLLFLGVQTLVRTRRARIAGEDGGEAGSAAAARRPARPRLPRLPAPSRRGGGAWRTGLTSNLLNPKIAVFYTGLLPTLAPAGLPTSVGLTLLVVLHVVITTAWLGGYVYLISRARPFFESPRVRRALDRITGVVLIGFGVSIAAESA